MHIYIYAYIQHFRVAFRNPKILHDKLVRSKIRQNDEEEQGNFPCGHITVKHVRY